jgi:transcriptional regulator with XRE-family HTH domain
LEKFRQEQVLRGKRFFDMTSDTITQGLKQYGIGSKLRQLRLGKSMGLVELARHTGLSPALLSKLEREIMHPTLPTLLRISMVFSVGLDYFFSPEPRPMLVVVRKAERVRFPESANARTAAYYFESLDFPVLQRVLNSYLAEFEPVDFKKTRLHDHPGIEFLYVISGQLELQVRDERHELAEGDAICFDSAAPHGYRKIGTKRSTALVVFVPS